MLSEGDGDEDRMEGMTLARGVLSGSSASGADIGGGIIEARRVVGGMLRMSSRAGRQACWSCELAR